MSIEARAREGAAFVAYVCRRFAGDRCLATASALTFTSLLALVPITAIGFAVLAAFPAFEDVHRDIQMLVFQSFLPDVGLRVEEYFTTFVENAGKLTVVGLLGLGVTAILLLATIESTLNGIWRVREARPWQARLVVYWTLLTLGPLLFGASLSLSGYLMAVIRASGVEAATVQLARLAGVVPLLLGAGAFALLYMILPNRRVPPAHAVVGGLTAALLFEVLKRLFAAYVVQLPTYQTIYGAVSALPIFLVWLYVSWGAVLFGAVVAASLGDWRMDRVDRAAEGPAPRLAVALRILAALLDASRRGETLDRDRLTALAGCGAARFGAVLDDLARAGFVVQSGRDRWVLLRDLEGVGLIDLYRALGLGLDGASAEGAAGEVLAEVAEAERRLMARGLKQLLAGPPAGAAPSVGLRRGDDGRAGP